MKLRITEGDIMAMTTRCLRRILAEELVSDPNVEVVYSQIPSVNSAQPEANTEIQTNTTNPERGNLVGDTPGEMPVMQDTAHIQNTEDPILKQREGEFAVVDPNVVAQDSMPKATRTKNGGFDYKNKVTRKWGFNDYGGMCAHGVGLILNKYFGIHDYAHGGIGNGGVNVPNNPKFTHVARVNANDGFPEAKAGDVGVFRGKMHATICLGNGVWACDTIQKRMNCFGGWNGKVDIYRPSLKNQKQLAEGLDNNPEIDPTATVDATKLNLGPASTEPLPALQDKAHTTPSEDPIIRQTQERIASAGENSDFTELKASEKRRIAQEGTDGKAAIVMQRLIKDLQMPKCSAAAVCGIIMAECGFNEHAFNKGERNGTNTRSAACAGKKRKGEPYDCKYAYGAGLIQWTFWPRKTRVLKMVGKDENFLMKNGLESLPLETQITMLEKELQSSLYSKLLQGLLQQTNVDDATILLQCNFVGGYSNSATCSPQRVAKINSMYAKGTLQKRIRYARHFYSIPLENTEA